jgi:hypothetical protein
MMRGDMGVTTVENVVVRGDIELKGAVELSDGTDVAETLRTLRDRVTELEVRVNAAPLGR